MLSMKDLVGVGFWGIILTGLFALAGGGKFLPLLICIGILTYVCAKLAR